VCQKLLKNNIAVAFFEKFITQLLFLANRFSGWRNTFRYDQYEYLNPSGFHRLLLTLDDFIIVG
jgi:hypothetical protein